MALSKESLMQGLNAVAFVATVAVNGLAGSTKLLNGLTSGEVSDLYPTLVTPAGYTFSIWGVIYVLLAVFTVYQVLPRNREEPFLRQVGPLFVLSGLLNASWLFLWHYEFIALSTVLMFALLATLIAIYLRLNIGRAKVSLKEKVCVHLPFSVYLGWITVASIANVAVTLTAVGWDGGGVEEVTWAALVIVVALVIAVAVIATRKDFAYGLVIVWALAGIMSRQMENQTLMLTTEVGIAIVLIAIAVVAMFSRLKR